MGWSSVAIIGSFRKYYDEIIKAARHFEENGISVLTPPDSFIINHGADFVRFECDPEGWEDHEIQERTVERMRAADFVFVMAPNGYVGPTTCYEIGRALECEKSVYYSEAPVDFPVRVPDVSIKGYEELTEMFGGPRMKNRLFVSTPESIGQSPCLESSTALTRPIRLPLRHSRRGCWPMSPPIWSFSPSATMRSRRCSSSATPLRSRGSSRCRADSSTQGRTWSRRR